MHFKKNDLFEVSFFVLTYQGVIRVGKYEKRCHQTKPKTQTFRQANLNMKFSRAGRQPARFSIDQYPSIIEPPRFSTLHPFSHFFSLSVFSTPIHLSFLFNVFSLFIPSTVPAIFTISSSAFYLLIFMRKCIMQTRRRGLRPTCR